MFNVSRSPSASSGAQDVSDTQMFVVLITSRVPQQLSNIRESSTILIIAAKPESPSLVTRKKLL